MVMLAFLWAPSLGYYIRCFFSKYEQLMRRMNKQRTRQRSGNGPIIMYDHREGVSTERTKAKGGIGNQASQEIVMLILLIS